MVMDIVKKNLVSIICGVVVLLCVVLIFFPFGGMYEELAADVKKGQAIGGSLDGVRKQPRTWPTLSSREEDRVALARFPTAATVDTAEKQTVTWKTDTDRFLEQAIELQRSHLKPLVQGALPGNPGQQTIAYNFMDRYRVIFGLKRDPTGKLTPQDESQTLYNTVIKAKVPPTDAEVTARQQLRAEEVAQQFTQKDDKGNIKNAEDVAQRQAAVREAEAIRARLEAARSATVYLDPVQVFKPSPKMGGTAAPVPNDIFEAQVGLWIQQEICEGIKQANAGAKEGVLDAPIKRVLDLKFTYPYVAVAGAPGGEPPVAPQNEATRVTMNYGANPLGHISGEFYDVVPFQISMIVEADRMPKAMTDFSANRYIMCRRVDLTSVDSALAFAQGYLYGSKPVVQLNIDGQYLILRKFIAPLMPPDIVRGLTPPAAPAS